MSTELKGPDFIGIGMERAGTSWLFTQIAAHPDVWVPPLKELHFFDVLDPQAKYLTHRYSYHLKSRLKHKAAPFIDMKHRPEFFKNSYLQYLLWDYYYFTGTFNLQWYKRLFHPKFTKGKVCGEITPAYSNLSKESVGKILQMNPEVKLLLMVRDAKDRLWSGLIHHFRHIEKRVLEDVSEEEMLQYLNNSAAQNRSDVSSILQTWKGEVPEKQLFIRPFEMIAEDPSTLIKEVYEFIGVEPSFRPPENLSRKKINSYTKSSFQKPAKVQAFFDELGDD